MKTTPLIPTIAAAALVAATAAPAVAVPPPPGPGGPGAADVLDQDFSLTATLAQTAPGRTRTRTTRGPDGTTRTVVTVRGAKAAGAADADLLTADGEDPGALTSTLRYTTRSADGDGAFDGVLTVASADGRLRLRLAGPANDDGSFEADITGARGSGSFAGIRVAGDVDVEAANATVAVDLEGEYEYRDEPAGPGPGHGPAGPGHEGPGPEAGPGHDGHGPEAGPGHDAPLAPGDEPEDARRSRR